MISERCTAFALLRANADMSWYLDLDVYTHIIPFPAMSCMYSEFALHIRICSGFSFAGEANSVVLWMQLR
jgi:hypothetical protein